MTKDPDWPLAGPIDDTVDEATDRFTIAGDTPAIQACFRRLATRLEELEKRLEQLRSDDLTSVRDELLALDAKWRAREDTLVKDVRDRVHKARSDATAALGEVSVSVTNLRADLVEHELADASMHADLVGKTGGGDGRVGELTRSMALWRKIMLGLVAGIAGSALTVGAWLVSFGDDRASMRERLGSVEREIEEMKGAQREQWRRLFNLPAHPAPPGE